MAHEVALGISHFAESETDQSQLFTRLSELTSTIAQGFLHVELITLLETNEPIPSLGFLEAYPDRVAEWVREALIDGA